jgi:hypothetical protein
LAKGQPRLSTDPGELFQFKKILPGKGIDVSAKKWNSCPFTVKKKS